MYVHMNSISYMNIYHPINSSPGSKVRCCKSDCDTGEGGTVFDFFLRATRSLGTRAGILSKTNFFHRVGLLPTALSIFRGVGAPGGKGFDFFVSDPGGVTTVWSLGTRTGISMTSSFLRVVVSSTGLRNLRLHRCDRTLFFRGVSGLTVLEMTMGEMAAA